MADDVVVFHRSELPLEAFPLMEDIRRRGKLCDVTLKVRKHFGDFDLFITPNSYSELYLKVQTSSIFKVAFYQYSKCQPTNEWPSDISFLEVKEKCFYVYVYKMGVHWYFR